MTVGCFQLEHNISLVFKSTVEKKSKAIVC